MLQWGLGGRFLLNVGKGGVGRSSASDGCGAGPCPSSPHRNFSLVLAITGNWGGEK